MIFGFETKRTLRRKIIDILTASSKLLSAKQAEIDDMYAIAERLTKDGHTATAHLFIGPIKGLQTAYKNFRADTLSTLARLEKKDLRIALARAEGFQKTLQHMPTKDDLESSPADEIILRLGIESKETESVRLLDDILMQMKAPLEKRNPLNSAHVRDLCILMTAHSAIMKSPPLGNFMAITKRYDALNQHIERLWNFRKQLT